MLFPTKARDLRVKIFTSSKVKDMEKQINSWLASTEEDFEVVDIIYERHYSQSVEKAMSTALIVFHII